LDVPTLKTGAPINTISTAGMKNGIYILNIQHEGGLFTKKIPLNR
jgi:hypothetical protein